MRLPDADTGAFPAPRPDTGTLTVPGRDTASVTFPPRPVFAVIITAPAMAAGVAHAVIVHVPWRDAAAAGGGTGSAVLVAATAITVDAAGAGDGTPTVVKTVIDAPAYGEGAASHLVAVTATGLVSAAGSGAGAVVTGVASVLAAAAAGQGTTAVVVVVTPAITVPAAATGAGSAAVTPSVAVTVAAAAVGAGSAVVFTGAQYSDDFDRANGPLGANWVTLGSFAPVIDGNKAQAGTSGPSNTGTVYPARWAQPVATDTHEVSCVVITPATAPNLQRGGGVFVRCDSAGNRVEALVSDTDAYIFTRIGGTLTQRATIPAAIPSGTALRIRASGNVYSVYLAGSSTPALTWTDTGGAISIGANNRYVGILTAGTENFSGTPTGYGYAIDNWVGKDS